MLTCIQRGWLVRKGLIKPADEKNCDSLVGEMKKYYYHSSDKVYNAWSDSELKSWLANHSVIKPEARAKCDQSVRLILCVFSLPTCTQAPTSSIHSDNFSNTRDTIWGSRPDSEIRSWLVDNGYLKLDAQAKRDELVKLADVNPASLTTAGSILTTKMSLIPASKLDDQLFVSP